MRVEPHHTAWILASITTVLSFVGITMYSQNRLARLDALSSEIETNGVPSIEYLSHAGAEFTRVSQLLDNVAAPGPQRAAALTAAERAVLAAEDNVARYVQLPPLEGETERRAQLERDAAQAIALVRAAITADRQRGPKAIDPFQNGRLDDALDDAVRSVVATFDFDVTVAERMARDVRSVRASITRQVILLDGVAILVALLALAAAYRASRQHERLAEAHNGLLAARVTELDRFAGRVAHDVLSPLGTVAAALPLLASSATAETAIAADRSRQALQRVRRLVDDLLLFARSGAAPDPAARCAIRDCVDSVVADCADEAAERSIDLSFDVVPDLEVACRAGVVASVVQNLIQNAIKFMGTSEVRRVQVRARTTGPQVRIEVTDTGPGVPPALRAAIFEPFVRGAHEGIAGAGLGLATVRRLVESHGGAVGVESPGAGGGSLFWITLPRAGGDLR
jgi:signal transduction histidine kinase